MAILDELEWRGLVVETTDREGINKLPPGTACYVGVDPTARSIHIGNLVPLLAAMHLGRAGLKPIILFGGATGSIGDPSGKRAERQLLDRATIEANVAAISATVHRIFDRAGVAADFVNNFDWTAPVSILDFLRDIGKHFTINYMLQKESVKTRVEGDGGMSFTEFSYMLLQSFDFLHLYEAKNCRLQFGGTDQWGNITAGLELIRRKIQGDAYAFSVPLILDSQGRKFGKSEGGAVWLDETMTSPFKFHQFWLNVPDTDVLRYLPFYTFLSQAEIAGLAEQMRSAPQERAAQRALADAVCTLVHGAAATEDARRSAQVLFGGSMAGLTDPQLEEIFRDVPSLTLPRERFAAMSVVELFAEAGLAASKGEARRLVASGGAYLSNERVTEPTAMGATLAPDRSIVVLRSGRKNYCLLRVEG